RHIDSSGNRSTVRRTACRAFSEAWMTTVFLHPGKRLGSNYEREAIVGTGQFGQVWRAKKLNPPSDTPVALKVPLDPHRGEEVLMADGKYMLDRPRPLGIVADHWQVGLGSTCVV